MPTLGKSWLVAGLLLMAFGAAPPSHADDVASFRALIEASAERLALAEPVASSKFARAAPVLDAAREQQVLDAAARESAALALPEAYVRQVVGDQIEANKLVQYALIAQWRAAGTPPSAAPPDLAATVRPRLDKLQHAVLEGLKDASGLRGTADCETRRDAEVMTYAHEKALTPLQQTALVRSLVGVCQVPAGR
ncbi:MAG TPA: chorismate mutase [Tahibacter sp.]|nr:chorismate mutase [Tahibacter sp.]